MPSFAINNFKNVMILTPLLSGKSVHLNRFCFLFIILSTTQNRAQLSFTINQGDFRHFSCFFKLLGKANVIPQKIQLEVLSSPILHKRNYSMSPNFIPILDPNLPLIFKNLGDLTYFMHDFHSLSHRKGLLLDKYNTSKVAKVTTILKYPWLTAWSNNICFSM